MKKSIYVLFIIMLLAVVFNVDSNKVIKKIKRINSQQYYVTISDDQPIKNSEVHWGLTYKLEGYSEKNDKRLLTFNSDRVLTPSKHLRVYVRANGEVISWEQVSCTSIPMVVKSNMHISC
ncbi:YxeA family protein [Vibrio sp. S4M6]|uniref:YxeA family protein n=1 Tax=Vibrio sinus TaxID=2946865 RepID=UPI002029D487|nr:YxeA family protein [Vibrio sinus]MCL9780709.1 YxeA family protein [Vibrio sinus]